MTKKQKCDIEMTLDLLKVQIQELEGLLQNNMSARPLITKSRDLAENADELRDLVWDSHIKEIANFQREI
jgi:hypothetical protein